MPIKNMILLTILSFLSVSTFAQNRPNILIVVADDLGTDALGLYGIGTDLPATPHIDDLASQGIQFNNTWANPTCSPTRAGILTGKYANKNLVVDAGNSLELDEVTLFEQLDLVTGNDYVEAAFGKWHIYFGGGSTTNPNDQGADQYVGSLQNLNDYYDWPRNENGTITNSTDYATTETTDEAIAWIDDQTQPWLTWVAYHAPHSPFHLPPAALYTRTSTNSNFDKYMCMIESVDHEFGRLYNSLSQAEKDSTLVIFVGDNGTPESKLQAYPADHGKGSLYEGGIRVPFVVSGYGVDRINEEENALVSVNDIFATLTEMVNEDLPGGVGNSFSFLPLLTDANADTRNYNYSEYGGPGQHITIRNDQYKLIIDNYFQKELYDLINDPFELTDLIASGLSSEQEAILLDLETEAERRVYSWSCRDKIQNGIETGTDVGILCDGCDPSIYLSGNTVTNTYQTEIIVGADGQIENTEDVVFKSNTIELDPGFEAKLGSDFEANIDPCIAGIDDTACVNDNSTSFTDIGCDEPPTDPSIYQETVAADIRTLVVNNYPNHYYKLKQNNTLEPIDETYTMDATPDINEISTSILNSAGRPDVYYGMGLNGVKLAPAPAQPFIFENTATGEYNWAWVFEPTNNIGNGMGKVALDCSAAHLGPQGYHYHGNMVEFAEVVEPGISTATVAPADIIQIGWAADGFPIFYRFAPDANGNLVLLQPSYQLKEGLRPGDGESAPCGSYTGKYTRDYEYIVGLADLDECNGIERDIEINTVEGLKTFSYFYVVTDEFPQIGRCLRGTPDPSFDN